MLIKIIFLAIFGPFLLILLQFLIIYACRDHAFFAAMCGPQISARGEFVSFFMSVFPPQVPFVIPDADGTFQYTLSNCTVFGGAKLI